MEAFSPNLGQASNDVGFEQCTNAPAQVSLALSHVHERLNDHPQRSEVDQVSPVQLEVANLKKGNTLMNSMYFCAYE